jgi:hypothetical protein
VLFTKVVVRPDDDVFIIQVSFDLVVWSSGEGISAVCCPGFIFEYDIVLLPFREVPCDAWSDFAGVTVISEICVVGVDNDGDRGPFE